MAYPEAERVVGLTSVLFALFTGMPEPEATGLTTAELIVELGTVLLTGTRVVLMGTVVDSMRVLLAGQEVTSGGQLVIVHAVVA